MLQFIFKKLPNLAINTLVHLTSTVVMAVIIKRTELILIGLIYLLAKLFFKNLPFWFVWLVIALVVSVLIITVLSIFYIDNVKNIDIEEMNKLAKRYFN